MIIKHYYSINITFIIIYFFNLNLLLCCHFFALNISSHSLNHLKLYNLYFYFLKFIYIFLYIQMFN
jgi:hypothetical protein